MARSNSGQLGCHNHRLKLANRRHLEESGQPRPDCFFASSKAKPSLKTYTHASHPDLVHIQMLHHCRNRNTFMSNFVSNPPPLIHCTLIGPPPRSVCPFFSPRAISLAGWLAGLLKHPLKCGQGKTIGKPLSLCTEEMKNGTPGFRSDSCEPCIPVKFERAELHSLKALSNSGIGLRGSSLSFMGLLLAAADQLVDMIVFIWQALVSVGP